MPFGHRTRRFAVGMATASVTASVWAGTLRAAPPGASPPKAAVGLVPSVSAVAPGASFDVAVAYELADDWHIYWKNPGMSGGPPRVEWRLPQGFRAGELRFPAPYRLESGPSDFKIVTYVHEGKPVLLATLTAPGDLAPGSRVTIAAKVTTLVCKDKCITESQSLSFELPAVADVSSVEPANKELFERAAERIPPANGRGKFITVAASPSVESVRMGGRFEVSVTVDIKPGYHVQSNRPYIAGLIPTEAIPEPAIGAGFDKPVYPEAKVTIDKRLGMKLSEFHGRPVIRIPVEVTEEAVGGSLELAGIVIAQACEDRTGRCFAPETVAWSANVALVDAPPAAVASSDDGLGGEFAEPPAATDSSMSLPVMLLFALLGGVILNITPCVLPVISIKVLSFVQQAHDDPRRVLRLGLLFGVGILVSFWLLGVFVVATKAAAAKAGVGGATWGAWFSYPEFVIAMIVILFIFGLSLFGVFDINLPGSAAAKLSAASMREGYAGAYLKGMLATALATPCTAPLLGTAIAVAFTQSNVVIMLAMTAIGVGMALPHVLLAARPAWMRFLPKPGPWMESFKQFMGFLLMGTVIWFLWVLRDLMGADGVVATGAFLTFLGLACWVYGKINLTWSAAAKSVGTAAVVAIALLGGWFAYGWMYSPPEAFGQFGSSEGGLPRLPGPTDWNGKTPWVHHRPGLHQKLATRGHTVFINYTATWCLKCQIEKKTVLEADVIHGKMRELGVVPIKADFTRRPDWIAEEMGTYGRNALPLNVILPAGKPDQPIILPELLTKRTVLEKLEEAGPSRAAPTGLASAP